MARDFEKFFKKDLEKQAVDAARSAAVEIMNGLAQAGPAYSGSFSSAWYAVEPGKEAGGPRRSGSVYKYTLRNTPKGKFRQGTYYEIVNGADYAPQALDLEEGQFRSQTRDEGGEESFIPPVKAPVEVGGRVGPIRGQVSGDARSDSRIPAISTAELDWYNTYTGGGMLQFNLEEGVKLGFRQGPFGGGGRTPGFG
jgi:hypothetical protein